MQQKIVRLMLDHRHPNAILAVYRTGEGKSHIIRMLGALDCGICAIFIPLLSLSADVMQKFQSAAQEFGSVRAYHLDEVFEHSKATYNEIMLRCSTLPPSTSSTIFLFMSPQHLCSSNAGLQTLLKISEKGTLRQVVLDEVHLHIEHGLSFREEIRKLKDLFFIPVFRPPDTSTFKPRLIKLRALRSNPPHIPTLYYIYFISEYC
jgi:superfamily II DNA helicase RecQ